MYGSMYRFVQIFGNLQVLPGSKYLSDSCRVNIQQL